MAGKPLAMRVEIDMDGDVISVKDKNNKDVPFGPPGSNIIQTIDHQVIISQGRSTCVTYQTPKGPRTV